jgi:poly [ADP-ribose] polymerase
LIHLFIDRHELTAAKDVKKLPKNKHSVKGCGMTEPDPNEMHVMPNGVKVPLGKAVPANGVKKKSLLYNEYVVYDTNQVNIKYLLKVKFNKRSLF